MNRDKYEMIRRLESLGFTWEEAQKLRRIEMTLHRWSELECGDGNDYASWSIERDDTTGKPFFVTYPHNDTKSRRRAIPDREAGAQRRLAQIMAAHPELVAYEQGDCRGCALYICRKADIGTDDINSVYTRGLAIA